MVMGRPPKDPKDRRTESLRLPVTEAEREAIERAATAVGKKPITWARDLVVRAAKRKAR